MIMFLVTKKGFVRSRMIQNIENTELYLLAAALLIIWNTIKCITEYTVLDILKLYYLMFFTTLFLIVIFYYVLADYILFLECWLFFVLSYVLVLMRPPDKLL